MSTPLVNGARGLPAAPSHSQSIKVAELDWMGELDRAGGYYSARGRGWAGLVVSFPPTTLLLPGWRASQLMEVLNDISVCNLF